MISVIKIVIGYECAHSRANKNLQKKVYQVTFEL